MQQRLTHYENDNDNHFVSVCMCLYTYMYLQMYLYSRVHGCVYMSLYTMCV